MIVDAKITRFRFSIYRFLFLLVFIFLFALIKSGHAHNGSPWVSVGPLIEAVQQAESADAIKCSREPAQGDPHFSQDAFDLWFQETIEIDVHRFQKVEGRKLLRISENLLFSDGSDSGLRTSTLTTSKKLIVTVKAKREVAMARYSCDSSSTEIMKIVSDVELSAPTTAAGITKKAAQPAGGIETVCLGLGFTKGTAKFEKCVSRLAREPLASEAVVPTTQQKLPAGVNKDVLIPDVKKSTPTVSPMCLSIEKKIDNHIQKSEYDLAQKAISLMDRLNCKVKGNQPQQESSISTQQLPVAKKVTQPKQLTCSIGPIWKPNFGRDSGYFSAKAFSSDPKTSCKVASAKCEAYAQAAAAGAQAAPNTQNPTSYSANCNTFGTIIQSTDCTVRPNTGGGGFVGGLAQGLASGLQTLAAKRGSMMSVFRSCMADEGFALTEK